MSSFEPLVDATRYCRSWRGARLVQRHGDPRPRTGSCCPRAATGACVDDERDVEEPLLDDEDAHNRGGQCPGHRAAAATTRASVATPSSRFQHWPHERRTRRGTGEPTTGIAASAASVAVRTSGNEGKSSHRVVVVVQDVIAFLHVVRRAPGSRRRRCLQTATPRVDHRPPATYMRMPTICAKL